jgi:hypothetical protein
MASNNSSEYKVVADKLASPDEDIIIQVSGAMYKDSIEEENRYATMADVGQGGGGGPLTVPLNVKDSQGANFITFTRTDTGTARIATPQDDLSLRSARDITLFAGDDGPGNVYIGWGDATYTPDSPNRVATIADITPAAKTYTADNTTGYGTYQANGFVEVTPESSSTSTAQVYSLGGASNDTSTTLLLGEEQNTLLSGSPHLRRIIIEDGNGNDRILRNPYTQGPTEGGYIWVFECDPILSLNDASNYPLSITHGGAPVLWWDADDEDPSGGDFSNFDFRGAKIEYHAYVSDAGTVIGTIYIANDSGDYNVTHIETSSGGSDTGTAVFWSRSGNERELYLYRTDGEAVRHKIQWTAQMYYASEYYDD